MWMIYSREAYECGRIFLTAGQKQAVEEGKKFAQRAYADVWARDAALVQRVRNILGGNFHWHGRLLQRGTDLEVIQTLQSMIRGESVVLVAEQSRSGGSTATMTQPPVAMPSFRESLMTGYGMTYEAASNYIDGYNAMVDRGREVAARYANRAVSFMPPPNASSRGSAHASRQRSPRPSPQTSTGATAAGSLMLGRPFST